MGQVFLLLLLALLALLINRRRGAILLLATGLVWFYLASTSAFGAWLMGRLEGPFPPVAALDLPSADAVVLLGGGVHTRKSDEVLGDLNLWSDRLLFATALYKAGKAPVIVISGGGQRGQPTEAELTRDILQVMGVPVEAMILERASRDTNDNARLVVPLLRKRGWNQVLLVTSAFHMRRAVALFAVQGLDVIPAPTDHQASHMPVAAMEWLPSLTGLTYTHYALHEMVGFVAYRLRGWL